MHGEHLIEDERYQCAARQLLQAHGSHLTFAPLTNDGFVRSPAQAYRVQHEYVRLMASASNAAVAGYKIGLTSTAMQTMFDISSPIAGVVLSDRVLSSPTVLHKSRYVRLGLEFEIAIRIARDLERKDGAIGTQDIAESVDAVCAAIEVIDDRAADYATLDALSLIVDNAWNAGIVLGSFVAPSQNLAECEGSVFLNGDLIGHAFGRDVLGHPYEASAWLANHLIAQGGFLRAGDIVMTGSLMRSQFPIAPARYDFELGALGSVHCHVEA